MVSLNRKKLNASKIPPLTHPIKGTPANSVDPDQTPQNAASDEGLHCLLYIQKFLRNIIIKTNQTPLIKKMDICKVLR